jgi:hypothetical protein
MLWRYENFPASAHGTARLTYDVSQAKLQQAILSAFHRLNKKKRRLEEVTYSLTQSCQIGFEFGVAEDATFTYLDGDELSVVESQISKRALAFLDFLCILTYHTVEESRAPAPLKFDYFMLRFAFDRKRATLYVSHERGPQHVDTEDLIAFLISYVKKELANLLDSNSEA